MIFEKGNKIVYGQDFCWYKGVPSGVDFEVDKIHGSIMFLKADGYGNIPGNYGNGSICVYLKEDFKSADKPKAKDNKHNDKIIKHLQQAIDLLEKAGKE
jgi:hypothetical protein